MLIMPRDTMARRLIFIAEPYVTSFVSFNSPRRHLFLYTCQHEVCGGQHIVAIAMDAVFSGDAPIKIACGTETVTISFITKLTEPDAQQPKRKQFHFLFIQLFKSSYWESTNSNPAGCGVPILRIGPKRTEAEQN